MSNIGKKLWTVISHFQKNYQPTYTESDIKFCEKIFSDVSHQFLFVRELQEIRDLLDKTCKNASLLHVVNEKGWNILHKAIICNKLELLMVLLDNIEGIDINKGVCSLPLHLACKLEFVDVIRFLSSKKGADISLRKGCCFPEGQHLQTCSELPYLGTNKICYNSKEFHCTRQLMTPLSCAISADKADSLYSLLHFIRGKKRKIKFDKVLDEACSSKAVHCVKMLVKTYSDNIRSTVNAECIRKLLYDLMMEHDEKNIVIFMALLSSESIPRGTIKCEGGEKSLLYLLYDTRDVENVHLLELTRLIIKNAPDNYVQQLGPVINCFTRELRNSPTLIETLLFRSSYASVFIEKLLTYKVKHCVRILVENGCNVNHIDENGYNVFHSLFGINLFGSQRSIGYICDIMQELITLGANFNAISPKNKGSAFYHFVKLCYSLSWKDILVLVPVVKINMQGLIEKEKAVFSTAPGEANVNIVTLLFNSLSRWLQECSPKSNIMKILRIAESLLIISLQHQKTIPSINTDNFRQISTCLNETISSIYENEDVMVYFFKFTKLLITYGTDPKTVFFGTTGRRSSLASRPREIQTKDSLAYHITRTFYILTDVDSWKTKFANRKNMLTVFGNTLSQISLNKCTDAIKYSIYSDFADISIERGCLCAEYMNGRMGLLVESIRILSEEPRSLKRLCCIVIYESLNWRIEKCCEQLPVPQSVILYLKTIDLESE